MLPVKKRGMCVCVCVGGGATLSRQNLLSVIKVICQQSLILIMNFSLLGNFGKFES